MQNNVVFIEFFNKKNFPPGDWMSEPDLCQWTSSGFECLVMRDMKLGIWRGFVGTTRAHKIFNKSLLDIINEPWGLDLEVYGGVSVAGKLPPRYKELNQDRWWIGFECAQGEDLFPLVKLDLNDPIQAAIFCSQSYKDIHFARRETNHLAQQLKTIHDNH